MISLADKFASRLAQLTPFGKRTDDPLTNIKAATRWIQTLPIGDAFKCQQSILTSSNGSTKNRRNSRKIACLC